MAIASMTDPEADPPQMIMVVVRSKESEIPELEKKIRSKDFAILQKKSLELSGEEVESWFRKNGEESLPAGNTEESEANTAEKPLEEEEVTYFGYVLQRKEATNTWNEMVSENERPTYCLSEKVEDEDSIHQFFPSVVTDTYLLQPENAAEFLKQLLPVLRAGLQQLCEDKPEDPIEYLAEWLDKNSTNS